MTLWGAIDALTKRIEAIEAALATFRSTTYEYFHGYPLPSTEPAFPQFQGKDLQCLGYDGLEQCGAFAKDCKKHAKQKAPPISEQDLVSSDEPDDTPSRHQDGWDGPPGPPTSTAGA